MPMKIALFADTFTPMQSAAAIQLDHLTKELIRKPEVEELTVVVPAYENKLGTVRKCQLHGLNLIFFGYPNLKKKKLIFRFFAELFLPFLMCYSLIKTNSIKTKFDMLIIYSPSIFIWPIYLLVRKNKRAKKLLILRDMFPQWAFHVGVIKSKLIFRILAIFSYGQYLVSDKILIQSQGDMKYFNNFWRFTRIRSKVEVLNNWLRNDKDTRPISNKAITDFILDNATLIYSGNLGVGQDQGALLSLAKAIELSSDFRLVIIGDGSEFKYLSSKIEINRLKNTKIFEQIPSTELRSIYKLCQIGVVTLNPRHQSNNIPGKFVAYLRDGLAILAFCNTSGDLPKKIRNNNLGLVLPNDSNQSQIIASIKKIYSNQTFLSKNSKLYFAKEFDVTKIVSQILK